MSGVGEYKTRKGNKPAVSYCGYQRPAPVYFKEIWNMDTSIGWDKLDWGALSEDEFAELMLKRMTAEPAAFTDSHLETIEKRAQADAVTRRAALLFLAKPGKWMLGLSRKIGTPPWRRLSCNCASKIISSIATTASRSF
jgi:hypothetical protein